MTKRHVFHQVSGYFWLGNIPFIIVAYFVMGSSAFQKNMILYITLISIINMAVTHFAVVSGERAKESAENGGNGASQN